MVNICVFKVNEFCLFHGDIPQKFLIYYNTYLESVPVAARCKARIVLDHLSTMAVGSNPTRCMSVFFSMLCCPL